MNRQGSLKISTIVMLAFMGLFSLLGVSTCSVFVGTYNAIQTKSTQVDAAGAQIKVQLKRRLDLLPNLATIVQGYATHERTTFTEIAQARAKLGGVINVNGTNDMQQLAQASSTLSGTIGRLLVLSEQYPELKANENFRDLQSQIEGTENRISVARQDYNNEVQGFNAKIKVFPNNVIANFMGVTARQFFTVGDSTAVENAPVIQLTPK